MSFLQVKDLIKDFGKTRIFEDINLSVEKGEFVVLLGPSGCGKSTLLNCIAGLLNYNGGNILMDGKDMGSVHPSQRDIAMVFQSYALYPNMTVRENISFGMKIRKIEKPEMENKIKEVSDVLKIDELLDRKPSQLSGGQQQRVAIGRALVRDPKLFLFDEPLSNLDAKLRVRMRTEIKRLHKKLKTTIIYVTHDQVEAMTLADKIAVMHKGKVVQYGTPQNVYFEPNSVLVAKFIGSPPSNIVSAIFDLNTKSITLKNTDQKITLTDNVLNSSPNLKNYDGQEILIGIRPENIHFGDKVEAKIKKNPVKLKMEFIDANGADNNVITELNEQEIICRLHNDVKIDVSMKEPFYFDVDRILFYDVQTTERI